LTLSGVDQFYTVMWITFVLTIAKASAIPSMKSLESAIGALRNLKKKMQS